MPWGQITPYAKPEDFYKADPEFWAKMGAEDRKRSYISDVKNAREKVKSDYQTNRENKAHTEAKSALEAQLKQAQAELDQINQQIADAEQADKDAIEKNQSMVANPSLVTNTTDMGAKGPNRSWYGNTPPSQPKYAPDYSQIPVFPTKGNR